MSTNLFSNARLTVGEEWASLPKRWKFFIYFLGGIIALILLSKLFERDHISSETQENVKTMIQKATQFYNLAGQDQVPSRRADASEFFARLCTHGSEPRADGRGSARDLGAERS